MLVLIAIGFIMALLSLFAYPLIFGIIGIMLGIIAAKRGKKAGLFVVVANMILMGTGIFFSGVILNNLRHVLGL
ncbi:MAG: hypothetical protein Q7J78_02130 [Clostridiales bacterium]|nr:hypothetical protein [Clostridiales bacterium]